MAILSQASYTKEEGATTIPDMGVHSNEWKNRASFLLKDDDIV
jgi:hypothetical protein